MLNLPCPCDAPGTQGVPTNNRVLSQACDLSPKLGRRLLPGNGVYHLDAVHEGRQSVDDSRGSPTVQGFDEALQRIEELHVVLRLVGGLGNIHVNLCRSNEGRPSVETVTSTATTCTKAADRGNGSSQQTDSVIGVRCLRLFMHCSRPKISAQPAIAEEHWRKLIGLNTGIRSRSPCLGESVISFNS